MTSAAQQSTRSGHRLRNFFLLLLLSALIAFALIGFGFVIVDQWGNDAYIRWGGLTIFTLTLFALFVGKSEDYLRAWRFWGMFAIILAVHLGAFAIVLTHVEEWKLTWFMVMVVEYPLFLFLRNNFVEPPME